MSFYKFIKFTFKNIQSFYYFKAALTRSSFLSSGGDIFIKNVSLLYDIIKFYAKKTLNFKDFFNTKSSKKFANVYTNLSDPIKNVTFINQTS